MSDQSFSGNRFVTHEVTNQPPELAGYNAYTSDRALRDAVKREGGCWAHDRLTGYGDHVGGELLQAGFEANDCPPTLHAFDRFGHRINAVHYHPAYHRSMALAKEYGLHSLSWTHDGPGGQVARAALIYMHNQVEAGSMCPITMTHASVPAIRHTQALADAWLPGILTDAHDDRDLPAEQKRGLTIGMGMTEKQGGSDVRANTTTATPVGDATPGSEYTLVGHKWFMSAPMSDAFLVLAQTEPGLSCFLMPRWRDDNSRNNFAIQRLKDKLGDRSNASAEVEFRDAQARLLGEPGRGVATILDMVAQTRLDCMLGSAGLMRQAVVQTLHHARHRKAFGQRLIDQPLMRNVLADMVIESEAAVALAMRLARAFESADEHETKLARIATPVAKFWLCKRAPALIYEAMECIGGNGYIEESILPRLYRQAPVNAIWEGSGNIQCLDMLRAGSRDPACHMALLRELAPARGVNPVFDAFVMQMETELNAPDMPVSDARRLARNMALALSAAALLRGDCDSVAAAFCQGRLAPQSARVYGTLVDNIDMAELLARADIV